MKTLATFISAGAFASLVAMSSCMSHTVSTRPQDPLVVMPASPGPNYVWVDGGWQYNRPNRAYVYRQGRWAVPSRPGRTWVSGRWVQNHRGWRYRDGHWR